MAIIMRPEPFSQEVNRLFNSFFGENAVESNRWSPAMDLVEAEDHFALRADLPGLGEGDVTIEVQENTLTVSGERRAEHEERGQGWHRVERSFGRFSRSLSLPEGVDAEAISASFDKGVLEVRIPKPEERKPRRVTIAAGAGPGTVEGTGTDKNNGAER
jgi:HSP20 family protein